MTVDTEVEVEAPKKKKKGLQRNPLQKARAKPTFLRLAINAKCWDCEGRYSDPNVQWRIGNCTIEDCGLHRVRPYQKLEGTPIPASLKDTPYDESVWDEDD